MCRPCFDHLVIFVEMSLVNNVRMLDSAAFGGLLPLYRSYLTFQAFKRIRDGRARHWSVFSALHHCSGDCDSLAALDSSPSQQAVLNSPWVPLSLGRCVLDWSFSAPRLPQQSEHHEGRNVHRWSRQSAYVQFRCYFHAVEWIKAVS